MENIKIDKDTCAYLEAKRSCGKLARLTKKNLDIAKKTSKLITSNLKEDLIFAKTHKPGFYANNNDEYMMIRGYEVDGSCDLARSGPNGERYGVFAHVTMISNETKKLFDGRIDKFYVISVYSISISNLWRMFHNRNKKNIFHKSTKETFDIGLKKANEDIYKEFTDVHTIDEYYEFISKFEKLYNEIYSKVVN